MFLRSCLQIFFFACHIDQSLTECFVSSAMLSELRQVWAIASWSRFVHCFYMSTKSYFHNPSFMSNTFLQTFTNWLLSASTTHNTNVIQYLFGLSRLIILKKLSLLYLCLLYQCNFIIFCKTISWSMNSCNKCWILAYIDLFLWQWTVPQMSIIIIYNSTWSILIQYIRIELSGDNLN